ncbi:plasmid pRiA4b ORF-3-like protein-domain-containing protein [Daldinia loculata]|nr:plasmid pRiA4b ORF-3-like protein-domain-containing protein [Daldinia loculata]
MATTETTTKCGNPKCDKTSSSTALQQCGRCKKTAYCSKDCQVASWPMHKKRCTHQNYIVKFQLSPEKITDPPVFRTLSCPADAVFYHLHMALQLAFGWATTHSFDFAVLNPDYTLPDSPTSMYQYMMMVSSMGQQPDPSAPQEYLFRVVDPVEQTAFSGIDRMHEGTRRHPNTTEKKADSYKLRHLFDDPKYSGRKMVYTYDFGDNWEHEMTVLGRADATADFVCIDGAGHYVAEDVGGTNGWQNLKEAYRTAQPSAEQRDRRRWFETQCSNADAAGLAGDRVNAWDRQGLNEKLKSDRLFEHFDRMGDASAAQMERYEQLMQQRRR